MDKFLYIQEINKLMKRTDDEVMLDFMRLL